MADPAPDNPQESSEAQTPTPAETSEAGDARQKSADAAGSARKVTRFVILCAAVALVAGGAGYVVAVLTTGRTPLAPASAQADEAGTPADTGAEAAVPTPRPDDTGETQPGRAAPGTLRPRDHHAGHCRGGLRGGQPMH